MKSLFLILSLFFATNVSAQQGLIASYLRLQPSTLPTVCSEGDLRFGSSNNLLNYCSSGNSWNSVGSGGGGGGTWGSITGTLSSQTDLQNALNLKSNIASPTFTGTVTAPTFSGALSGNASTATALAANPTDCTSNQYATTIAANGNLTCATVNYNQLGGVLPNPSSSTLGGVESLAAVSHNFLTSITTSGVPVAAQPAFTDISGTATNAQTTATSSNTASAIVARDGSGNFTAGTITAALTGNASTATSATNFSGSLVGDVTGTQGATVVGKINGTSLAGLSTGILKNTTTTGVPSIAIAADFPTLNQNTTGTASNISATSNSTLTTLSVLNLPVSQLSGVLPIASGGTDNGTLGVTAGGVLYTDGTEFQNVGAGTTGQVLSSNGASAPSWITNTPSFSGLTTGGVVYATSSSAVTSSAAGTSGQILQSNGTSAPSWTSLSSSGTAPTIQKFLSSSGTYTLPTGPSPLYIRIVMIGAGGGGAGSGGGGTNGGAGGNTTFGTSLLVGNGGSGGISGGSTTPAAGGTASLGSGPIGLALAGAAGQSENTLVAGAGGNGASTPLSGGGAGGAVNGIAGTANSGAGGGGGGGGVNSGGAGGGAGGYVDAIITSPSSTYSYAVGAAGTAGTAGTGGAGAVGGSGIVTVYEYYSPPVLGGGGLSLLAFGSSPNANGATVSGSNFTLQPASGSFPGGVSTTTQTFAGSKTFGASAGDAQTIGASSSTANHQINGGVNYTTHTVTGSTYTVDNSTTDYMIFADSTSNPIAITLPTATNGRELIIEDKTGQAVNNNVTIIPASGTVNGAAKIIIGAPYSGYVLTSDGTNWVAVPMGGMNAWAFGDGADGSVSITSGTTTLTRDMYYQNLTISGTGVLKTANFKVFVAGILNLTGAGTGAITQSGGNGGNGANSVTGGSAGALIAATAQTLGVGTVGIIGGAGGTSTGAQGAASTTTSPGQGGPPGATLVGGSGSSNVGGAAGAGGAATNGASFNRFAFDLIRGAATFQSGVGGRGGNGGGGDASVAGGGGGGGGAGGNIIYIAANLIKTNGAATSAVQSLGGNGGNGGSPASGTAGGGSGGPGGGGGWIYLAYGLKLDAAATSVLDVSGGTGGAGGNGTFSGASGGGGGGGGGGGRITVFNVNTGVGSETFGGTPVVGNSGSTTTGGGTKAGQATQVTF